MVASFACAHTTARTVIVISCATVRVLWSNSGCPRNMRARARAREQPELLQGMSSGTHACISKDFLMVARRFASEGMKQGLALTSATQIAVGVTTNVSLSEVILHILITDLCDVFAPPPPPTLQNSFLEATNPRRNRPQYRRSASSGSCTVLTQSSGRSLRRSHSRVTTLVHVQIVRMFCFVWPALL